MKTDYVELHQSLEGRLAQLGNEIPGPMTGFNHPDDETFRTGGQVEQKQ